MTPSIGRWVARLFEERYEFGPPSSPRDSRARAHCPGPLPLGAAGPASCADQRIAPGLVVQVAQPGLAQGLNGGVCNHRGPLGAVDLVAARDVQPPGARSGTIAAPPLGTARRSPAARRAVTAIIPVGHSSEAVT